MKRTLIILSIALLLIGAGVGIYFFFSNKTASITVTPTDTTLPLAGQTSSGGGGTQGSSLAPGTTLPDTPVAVTPRLVQISAGPVVPGEVLVTKKAVNASSSPETVVSYIERESGNVFTYSTKTHSITRINNKTIPGIQSASWLPDGSYAFVQYLSGPTLSTVNTYALASSTPNGFFLPQNLSGVAASSTGILTLVSGVNGSIASLSHTDGTHTTPVFTTPLTALRVSFAGKNTYSIFSKPASTLLGDAFIVDSAGHFSRIAGPLNGLVSLVSPSGKWALVSYSPSAHTMQLELVNTSTHAATVLPIATIADKCVWAADDSAAYCGVPVDPSASAAYPDDWYQGAVQFSDRIWKINVAGRYAQMTLDFSTAGKGALDATALAIDPLATMLTFVNKNDGSLWGYSL